MDTPPNAPHEGSSGGLHPSSGLLSGLGTLFLHLQPHCTLVKAAATV
jgi:hypothetical protein